MNRKENQNRVPKKAEKEITGYKFKCRVCGVETHVLFPVFLLGCLSCSNGGVRVNKNYMELVYTLFKGGSIKKATKKDNARVDVPSPKLVADYRM